eukprot:TRINITY_DN834_c0_g1_i1.p1 TRINITY_DN834_c0_g1~~TRINITY_DN834_c0_g1_i1.p1  ORF type:complete len:849 (-),score=280.63 TRINITY_DN834_c0_g1_i1:274-2820(-)
MDQIFQVLANAASPDPNLRQQAEHWLQEAEKANYSTYCQMLVQEMTNAQRPPQARQLAGLVIKNSLTAKDDVQRQHKSQRWLAVDGNLRNQMKAAILANIGSPDRDVRASAAQVVAKIGQIELPRNAWPELVQALLANMQTENDALKQSTLETLGYICEDIEEEVLAAQANQILTAVCKGIKDNNNDVKFAGCNALFNALEFVRANFDKEVERNYIMTVICEAASSPEARVRVSAFECLVRIATLYYDKLGTYMQKLFNITLEAIRKDQEQVALQAVEFWSAICDEEIEIAAEAEEASEMTVQPTRFSQNFIKGALQFLVPLLTECLTRQDDEPDEDTWNVAMAAGTCLSLMAATVEDDIVNHVMPFVQANINNENWKFREAATLAFGAILEGPKNYVSTLTTQAMPILIQHLKDPVEHVKDTTAWTIGRIIQLHPHIVTGAVPALLQVLLECIGDVPKVAAHVCWCIHNLAVAFEDDADKPSNALSPFFGVILQKMLQITERDDADEANLRSAAYEAINTIITAGADDTKSTVLQMTPLIIQKLEQTFAMQIVSADDRSEQYEVQSLLCGVLQVISSKLGTDMKPFADRMMTVFLQVFNSKNVNVHEEALMAVGSVANAIEGDFEKYMPFFKGPLVLGLKSVEEFQVVSVSVGVVGDVSRALGQKMAPFCDEIVQLLLHGLQNPLMHRSVKPTIISCFGDIALAIGGAFVPYLGVVMNMLQQAASTTVTDTSDAELVDYLNDLREAIFEAYTGIVQGLRGDNVAEQNLLPYLNNMIQLCGVVAPDNNRPESVTRGALGLLGDIAHAMGNKVKVQMGQAFVKTLISDGLKGESTKEVAIWARDVINKL